MTNFDSQYAAKPTNIRWVIFCLAGGTSWLLYLHRYIFAFIKPELAEQWGLTTDQLGLLDSVFSLFYTIFQFPIGILTDVAGVHAVLTVLMLVWSSGLAMYAWVPAAEYLWYAQALLGIGQSAVYANLSRISGTWFPLSIRTTLQGIVGVLAGRTGGLSAYLIFGFLLLGVFALDWRTAVNLMALVGVGFALVFVVVFRNRPRRHPLVNREEADLIEGKPAAGRAESPSYETPYETPSEPEPPRMTVGEMLANMRPRALVNLICLNVQTILSTFADNIYSAWIPLFLWQVHKLQYQEMGIFSALPLLGGAIAGLIGGWLNDYFIARTGNRRWSRTGVAAFGKGMAAVLIFTALMWYDNPYIFCAFLFFVKLFGDWSLTSTWGVVTDIGGRATASVFAFNNSVAGIGSIAAPAIYGFIARFYGWEIVFITAGVVYVLCALSWFLIDSTIPVLTESPTTDAPSGA